MPVRNVRKSFAADAYYHVYSRGIDKQSIFRDEDDFLFFLSLFKRYLSVSPVKSTSRVWYPNYHTRLSLISYCLMPNHIHLFIWQKDSTAMSEFMKSLLSSYTTYFNAKYKRYGPLFQSKYLASRVTTEAYYTHITRYIHLNPTKSWRRYPYSSIRYYLDGATAEWISPNLIMAMFRSTHDYEVFVADYVAMKESLDELKWELADSRDLD